MPYVPEKERAEDERMQHMSNIVLQEAQLCDDGVSDMRRGWRGTPALSMNGREQCDYCRGSDDCSDALTWNTIISVSQIKSIFGAIAVFSFYNIYTSQYSRQRSFLWYKNIYVTYNTGCYIDVLIWVIFDPHA